MLIYSFITDYQAFNLRYKDNTTRDKNETKVDKQSANLGKNNDPIQNRLSFLIDCKSVILHHLAILSFPMVRPAWDNWWIPLNEKRLLSGIEYTLVLHVEQNDIQERFKQVLCDSLLMTKATEVGLERDSKDNRVFYKTMISSKRSISDMTHEELADFLREVYKDVENIQVFVSEYILNH